MHRTTRSICDWLESHPESLPKARRFAEYYIPTTLKLLYTYNDVQGQKGGNAEAIRPGYRRHPAYPEPGLRYPVRQSCCRIWRWMSPARSQRWKECWPVTA